MTAQIISKVLLLVTYTFVFTVPSISQWVRQQVPGDVTMLLGIDFSDNPNGVAAGHYQGVRGRILYTTDGGLNWLQSIVPDSARSIVSIKFVGQRTAFAFGAYNLPDAPARGKREPHVLLAYGYEQYLRLLGFDGTGSYRGYALKTTDGGQSWFPYGTLPAGVTYLTGVSFVNARVGYASGDTAESFGGACILRTTDGAVTWSKLLTPDSIVSFRDICFVDSLSGVAVGYCVTLDAGVHGVIIQTSDGGTTWRQTRFPQVNSFVSVSFSNTYVGYASGPSNTDSSHGLRGLLYKTTDGGASWTDVPFVGGDSVFENHLKFMWGTDVGILYGIHATQDLSNSGPFVARTIDGASSWITQPLTGLPAGVILVGGTMLSPVSGYISGGDFLSSAVVLHTNNGGIVAVARDYNKKPPVFRLDQNYPNPFNPNSEIRYQISEIRQVKLTVYDLLGRELATLVDEVKEPGTHTVQFDAAGLASGVYLYRLTAGSFVETRKMVVVK